MKLGKSLPTPSRSDKRLLLVSGGIFLATCILVALSIITRGRPTSPSGLGVIDVPAAVAPLPVEVIARLTELPGAPMLTGAQADEIHSIEQMVADCPDYSTDRRDQIKRHIDWLIAPATLPKEMIIALGGNTNGRLISGIATFTLAEWGLKQKAASSCLLPIGKKLNELLVANGEQPFPDFDIPIG